MRINYTASILFPFVGLIFGKHSTEHSLSMFSALFLYTHFFCCYHILSALSSNFHIKQTNRFVEILHTFEWTKFKCGTLDDCYFQDILPMFIVVRIELGNARIFMEIVTPVRFSIVSHSWSQNLFNQFDGWPLHMKIHHQPKYTNLYWVEQKEWLLAYFIPKRKIWFPFSGRFLTLQWFLLIERSNSWMNLSNCKSNNNNNIKMNNEKLYNFHTLLVSFIVYCWTILFDCIYSILFWKNSDFLLETNKNDGRFVWLLQ